MVALLPPTFYGLGNDNPTGVAGVYNGNVSTGCSYDPYTGNAARVIDDVVVPGAVGSYPLAFRRYLNTRNAPSGRFGSAGHWSHSYEWFLGFTTGHVQYPDGRSVNFALPCNTVCSLDEGRSERLRRNADGSYDLLLADGGQVHFGAASQKAELITDPFGVRTTLSYNGDGTLSRITEQAGRYLQISYISNPWESRQPIISSITASDGRGYATQSATYSYSQFGTSGWASLTSVNYSNGTSATYTYQADNQRQMDQPSGAPIGPPLISTCDDVRFAGPMRKIRYTYAASSMGSGVINEEQSGTTGERVSNLTYPFSLPDNENGSRTETRGDGATRNFNYSNAHLLSYTDYQNHTTNVTYDGGGTGYPWYVDDANANRTVYTREGVIGAITQVTFADNSAQYFSYSDPANPYYLASKTDGRTNGTFTTYYDRTDGFNRVTQIRYPDGGSEGFTYNSFGQVTTHRRANGNYEHYVYDSRGLLIKQFNPMASSTLSAGGH